MRKIVYFLSLSFIFLSCSVKKQPVFIKVDNVKVLSFASDTIKLKADAFFENPNNIGGKISTDDLKILVNEIEVAQVFSEDFKVPANSNFSIPLLAHIPTKKLSSSNKNGGLSSLLNSILSQKVNVRIKGKLQYKVFGFKREFLVDKTEEIKIKF